MAITLPIPLVLSYVVLVQSIIHRRLKRINPLFQRPSGRTYSVALMNTDMQSNPVATNLRFDPHHRPPSVNLVHFQVFLSNLVLSL